MMSISIAYYLIYLFTKNINPNINTLKYYDNILPICNIILKNNTNPKPYRHHQNQLNEKNTNM